MPFSIKGRFDNPAMLRESEPVDDATIRLRLTGRQVTMASLASEVSGTQMVEFFGRFGRFGGSRAKLQRLLGDDEVMEAWVKRLDEFPEFRLGHGGFHTAARGLAALTAPWPGSSGSPSPGSPGWCTACSTRPSTCSRPSRHVARRARRRSC